MLLRRNRRSVRADEADVAARLRGLWTQPADGWVPERLPGDATCDAVDATPPDQLLGELGTEPVGASSRDGAAATQAAEDDVAVVPTVPMRGRRGAGLLPARLTTGRLDVHRGAAAGLLAVAVLAAALTAVVVLRSRPQPVAVPQVVSTGVPLPGLPSPSAEPSGQVVVAVAGKVVHPGVVRLPAGSRVDDAVRAAGGVLPGAAPGLLNLARKLVDGEQVLVGVDPPPGTAAAAVPGGAPAAGGKLDLNAASASDLDALPGIGPVLAQRIVDWRTEHGRFESVDQLREVTGIGEAKFGDLKNAVVVG